MAWYEIPARISYNTYIYIEAEGEKEALERFEEGDFDDVKHMEMVEWFKTGSIQVLPE